MRFTLRTCLYTGCIKTAVLLLLTVFFASALQAATLYKWVDADGNIVYQDTPPPGNVEFEESTVDGVAPEVPTDTGKQIEQAALDNPVTLFTVEACDACDLVRLFLEKKAIPFAEKDVRNNQETQAELQELSGTLSVPTLIIGSTVLDGFSRVAITRALEEAGFPLLEEKVEETPSETTETITNEASTAETGTAEISGEGESTNTQ